MLRAPPDEEEEEGAGLRKGLVLLDKGGAVKSIPFSSSVYDVVTLPCSHWLAVARWEEPRVCREEEEELCCSDTLTPAKGGACSRLLA